MNRKKIVAIVAVAAIAACACIFCLPKDDDEGALCITGEVTGFNSYMNLLLSFSADDMLEKGFCYGDYLAIEVGDYRLKSVEFVENLGCASYFSVFVAKGSDGAVVGVFSGPTISAEVGDKITVRYDGKCEGYSYMTALKYMETDIDKFSNMEDYANFYELTGGDLAPGRVYRSYSIFMDENVPSKSWYVNQFAEEHGIAHMIMLPYSESDLEGTPEWFDGTYGQKLIDEGSYTAVDMSPADMFTNPQKTRDVFSAIIDNDGPYLLFCECGKDRTGLMCILIQGLCGASNEEIRDSYMKSFENLYLIEEGTESYRAVQHLTYEHMIYLLAHPDMGDRPYLIDWSDLDISGIDVSSTVISYLKGTIGLTDEQISLVREKLTSPSLSESIGLCGALAEAA